MRAFFCWFVLFSICIMTAFSFTSRGLSFYRYPSLKKSHTSIVRKLSVIKEPQSKLSSGTGKFRKFECEQCGINPFFSIDSLSSNFCIYVSFPSRLEIRRRKRIQKQESPDSSFLPSLGTLLASLWRS